MDIMKILAFIGIGFLFMLAGFMVNTVFCVWSGIHNKNNKEGVENGQ